MKRRGAAFALLLFAGLLAGPAGLLAARPAATPTGEEGAPRSVSFHVVAASDTPQDQALKLRVRDAVAGEAAALGAAARTPAQAEALVLRERGRLLRRARAEVRRFGSDDPVRLEVRTRGDRRQVRLVIGAGAGHNWFCVLYPPLCVVVREDRTSGDPLTAFRLQEVAAADGRGTIVAAPKDLSVEVRSAFLDWFRSARQRFAGRALVGRLPHQP